jgi:hypothetical protein
MAVPKVFAEALRKHPLKEKQVSHQVPDMLDLSYDLLHQQEMAVT